MFALGIVWQPARGQDTINRCIDKCYGSCDSYPTGSSSKQSCVDQCIEYTCKAALKVWGAIAYSKTERVFGYSFEMPDALAARQLALDNCRKNGKGCVVETAFSRTCAALAAAGDRVGLGTAPTKQAAAQRAMTECQATGVKGCEVQVWVCSAPNASGPSGTAPAPAPPPAPKAVAWGAIAYSAGDMGAGWAQGKSDRATAEREAMAACRRRGKACLLRTAFNKQCGALAADRGFEGWGTSTDAREAQQKAMDECRNAGGTQCALHIMFCSM